MLCVHPRANKTFKVSLPCLPGKERINLSPICVCQSHNLSKLGQWQIENTGGRDLKFRKCRGKSNPSDSTSGLGRF